jgi:hypothetical protein
MSCIDNIVTLGICPDDGVSKSGFTLMQAPGMSLKTFADTASDTYTRGLDMVMAKKSLALMQFRNDFIGALQSNKVVSMTANPVYDGAMFDIGVSNGLYNGYRGVTLHKSNKYRGSLRRTKIKAIQVYPLGAGAGTIKIEDGYNSYTYPVTFVANQVNTFDADVLDGFPFVMGSPNVRVTIDNSTIAFASAPVICHEGCHGQMPNDCGWVNGWDGTKKVKKEAYGINLQFQCECDYEQVICDLSYTGELIWLKWQIAVYDEVLKSNRFSNIVVYKGEQIEKQILPDLESQYVTKWNEMMAGVLSVLQTYRDDCLNCRGIRWRTNG